MKTCRGKNGPHQYSDDLKRCPECWELWYNTLRQFTGLKTCRSGLHQYPNNLKKCPECYEIWRKSPEAKAAKKQQRQQPEVKAKEKAYKQKPDYKEKQRVYNNKPEVKAAKKQWAQEPEHKERQRVSHKRWYDKIKDDPEFRAKQKMWRETPQAKQARKEWNESPKGKAWKKDWEQSPKGQKIGKAASKKWKQSPKGKASGVVYGAKRSIVAARGDLTTEQWLERQVEFNHCCAYCQVQLLTATDNVDHWHPQYLTLEHIVPLFNTNGEPLGQHTKANVIPACYKCNNTKWQYNIWEWMEQNNLIPSPQLLPILIQATLLHNLPLPPQHQTQGA